MQQELERIGIVDITEQLGLKQGLQDDLLYPLASHKDNLREIIFLALCRIQDLRAANSFECSAPLYLLETQQGVHIELPTSVIDPITRPRSKIKSHALNELVKRNRGKIALAAAYFEEE